MKRYDVLVYRIDQTHIDVEYKPSEYGMWVKHDDSEAEISKLRRCGTCRWGRVWDMGGMTCENANSCDKWEMDEE